MVVAGRRADPPGHAPRGRWPSPRRAPRSSERSAAAGTDRSRRGVRASKPAELARAPPCGGRRSRRRPRTERVSWPGVDGAASAGARAGPAHSRVAARARGKGRAGEAPRAGASIARAPAAGRGRLHPSTGHRAGTGQRHRWGPAWARLRGRRVTGRRSRPDWTRVQSRNSSKRYDCDTIALDSQSAISPLTAKLAPGARPWRLALATLGLPSRRWSLARPTSGTGRRQPPGGLPGGLEDPW